MGTRFREDWVKRMKKFGLMILGVTISFCLVFILQGEAQAEEKKNERPVFSLKQLIIMAIEKSPEIRERQSEMAATKSELEQVRATYYPLIESTAVIGPVENAKRPEVRGNRIIDPSAGGVGIFGRMDFTVTQPLYTFGKLSNREEAAHRGVKAKEFNLLEKKYEIALRVKQLYYALILAQAGFGAANDAEAFFEDAKNRMNRLLELGSANVVESDLYRTDAYRADTIRSRAEAEKGTKVASFALKSLIGWPPDVDFDLPEKVLSLRVEELTDLESYIKQAFAERPEIKQLEEAIAAQEFQVKAVQSDKYPSFFVALEGSFAGAPGRETLHNPYIPDAFNHINAGVVAGIKWNFDFGIGNAKVDKERAEYQRLLHTKASGKLNIPIQVVKSYQEVQEWKVTVDSYGKAAVASRKWVITALANFNMGVGTADDMLRAIEKYGQNQSKYLEALFNYNISLAELKYATGMKDW